MRQIWEVMKLLVGALWRGQLRPQSSRAGLAVSDANIGIILSGGNLDLDRLPWQ